MRYLLRLLTSISIWIFSATAYADPQDMVDPEQASELVERGEIISLDQLIAQHRFLTNGRMLDLELEHDEEWQYIYEISLLGHDGYIVEYEFEAATGNLIQEEFQE